MDVLPNPAHRCHMANYKIKERNLAMLCKHIDKYVDVILPKFKSCLTTQLRNKLQNSQALNHIDVFENNNLIS